MTLEDPFASAPATDEAQTAPEPEQAPEPAADPEPAPVPAKKAAAKTAGPKAVAASEGKVVLTFKGGSGYDAPWIVIHAADLQDAHDQVNGDNAILLAQTMAQVHKAGAHFAGTAPAKPAVAPGGGSGQRPQSAPPQGAQSAPGGETRSCKHGEMQFRSGFDAKNNRTWKAFMCPTPKGTPDQCKPEWIRDLT